MMLEIIDFFAKLSICRAMLVGIAKTLSVRPADAYNSQLCKAQTRLHVTQL